MSTEQLCLFCEPLTRLDGADNLIAELDLLNHVERYTAQGDRVFGEARRFAEYGDEFVAAADQHFEQAGAFATDGIVGLPLEVRHHFEMAKHLISIEAYEMGMLSALRGLESTLRVIFRRNRTTHDRIRDRATLGDLINAARQFRWARGNQPVLAERTAQLLEFLRVARNAAAHGGTEGEEDWHETTRLALAHARRLWAASQNGRRRIAPLPPAQRGAAPQNRP